MYSTVIHIPQYPAEVSLAISLLWIWVLFGLMMWFVWRKFVSAKKETAKRKRDFTKINERTRNIVTALFFYNKLKTRPGNEEILDELLKEIKDIYSDLLKLLDDFYDPTYVESIKGDLGYLFKKSEIKID